jgi:hypothetical protein
MAVKILGTSVTLFFKFTALVKILDKLEKKELYISYKL